LARSSGEGAKRSSPLEHWSPAPVQDGGRAARAERKAQASENGFPLRNSKDVPRFAQNFSVYVLPPDSVCLYSEDRKFFLHGTLYCAVAAAIGEGGKSFREIVRELEPHFPADKIGEALKRLVDRRYLVLSPRSHAASRSRSSADQAAAYWASLGVPPEVAKENLQKCSVRIQSIDVQGAKELGRAWRSRRQGQG
jgi:oxazoline/thiazoline synthase